MITNCEILFSIDVCMERFIKFIFYSENIARLGGSIYFDSGEINISHITVSKKSLFTVYPNMLFIKVYKSIANTGGAIYLR